MSDRVARAALCRLSEPGDVRMSRLVAQLGAERVYQLLREEKDVSGVYTDVAVRLRGLDPERELHEAAEAGIRFVCPGDAEWPTSVNQLDHAGPLYGRGGTPLGLWVKGPLSLWKACASSVAVVGSRSATSYGAQVAADIAATLAGGGMCVISGAAFGIDQYAHRGALAAQGSTLAVLACGVDRPYPAAHKNLLDYIADVGLVVSELAPGCAPTRLRFLARNRVIAALARGTVVVEAALRSGALNTANWTSRLHRQVMGVPGPVTSEPSAGVHELLRSGSAALVTCGADVLELLSPAGSCMRTFVRGEDRPYDTLTDGERRVLDAVPVRTPAGVEPIARTAGLGHRTVHETLERLQCLGFVDSSGSLWRLRPASGHQTAAAPLPPRP